MRRAPAERWYKLSCQPIFNQLAAPLVTSDSVEGRMGEVIRLFDPVSSRADMAAALCIDKADALANILFVAKYWEFAIAQFGCRLIDLPASSQVKLRSELSNLESKLCNLKSALEEQKRSASNSLPDVQRV